MSGFTALEWNTVTRKFVLPGSAADKIGAPKDLQGICCTATSTRTGPSAGCSCGRRCSS
jgi:hypothetical protein